MGVLHACKLYVCDCASVSIRWISLLLAVVGVSPQVDDVWSCTGSGYDWCDSLCMGHEVWICG